MIIQACFLALAALGSGDSTEAGESHVLIRVKSLEMKGVDWRSDVNEKLQPCTTQGTATVWTADGATAAAIAKAAAKVIDAPKITTVPGSPASIVDEINRNYVAEILRPNGPNAPFEPKIQTVHDGWRGSLTCRPLDQGVLAGVSIDATQFMAFHLVKSTGRFEVEGKSQPQHFSAQYQVPEVASSHVAGDWLIPKNGCLVIAFGVHTVAKPDGKSAPVERVLVIQAEPFSAEPTPVAVARPNLTFAPDASFPIGTILPPRVGLREGQVERVINTPMGRFALIQPEAKRVETKLGKDDMIAVAVSLSSPTPLPIIRPTMPKLPSRGMPQAFNAEGQPVDLPTLPDNALEPVSGTDESGEPCPSPQSLTTVRDLILKSLSGITSADAAELLSLLRNPHEDDLSPIDEEVQTTSTTEEGESCKDEKVQRFSLGGGIVVEVPAKYLLKNVGVGGK